MKILKRPKILPCECKVCHAVFQPKWKKLIESPRLVKEIAACPLCNHWNDARFEKGATDERAD